MQNFYHNIGFLEKRHFFRRKLSKIAENCDHNIDPGMKGWIFRPVGLRKIFRPFGLGPYILLSKKLGP
jgi:hypothetical protein